MSLAGPKMPARPTLRGRKNGLRTFARRQPSRRDRRQLADLSSATERRALAAIRSDVDRRADDCLGRQFSLGRVADACLLRTGYRRGRVSARVRTTPAAPVYAMRLIFLFGLVSCFSLTAVAQDRAMPAEE